MYLSFSYESYDGKIKNIIDSLCALIKGILMEKKDDKELPCEPEYFVNTAYTNVCGFIHGRHIYMTSKENRLLLSMIQTLICVIDAVMIVRAKLDAPRLHNGGKYSDADLGFFNQIAFVGGKLRNKFYEIMRDEDMGYDNIMLKSVKIVL